MLTIERLPANRPDAVRLIEELDQYLLQLYPPDSNYLLDIEALMQPNIYFVLAFNDGKTVGCGALRLESGYGEIKRMYVKPTTRGMGVGYGILSALEAIALEQGRRLVRLETGTLQPEALRLYERNGYTRCGAFGDYRADDPYSVFYEKWL